MSELAHHIECAWALPLHRVTVSPPGPIPAIVAIPTSGDVASTVSISIVIVSTVRMPTGRGV